MDALYHFTAPATTHLGSILREGRIRVTESNVSFDQEHAGPPVVWLTSNGELHGHKWHADGPKLGARLTVEVEAEHYPDFAKAHGVSATVMEALADSGGDPAEWWVATRPIDRLAIVALDIFPNEFEVPEVHVEGAEMRRLFQSRGAQRTLQLVEAKRAQATLARVIDTSTLRAANEYAVGRCDAPGDHTWIASLHEEALQELDDAAEHVCIATGYQDPPDWMLVVVILNATIDTGHVASGGEGISALFLQVRPTDWMAWGEDVTILGAEWQERATALARDFLQPAGEGR